MEVKINKIRKPENIFIVIASLSYYTLVVNTKFKILIAFLLMGVVIEGFLIFRPEGTKDSFTNTILEAKKNVPSETFIDYADPAGFGFVYPDNLSIEKNEADQNSYADITISSKDVSGSLNLKIIDSKFKTIDEWVKLNEQSSSSNKTAALEPPKEKMLGNLKATQIKTSDRLYLGALDQGILFTVEMPLLEQDFWMKVYEKVIADFSFGLPEVATAQSDAGSSLDDITFEGEEVVE